MGAIVSSLFGLLFGTLAAGAWIGIALLATAIGLALLFTGLPIDRLFPQYVYNILTTPDLVALPLFILMGEFLFRTRLSAALFTGLAPWAGLLPGRLRALVEFAPKSLPPVSRNDMAQVFPAIGERKRRVALMTSDQAWLWARRYEGGGPHTQLLRRLSHWLMKEPDLEEERLKASANGLKITIERLSMEDGVPPVTVQGPGGGSSTVTLEKKEPGIWRGTISVRNAGLYKLETPSPHGGMLTAVTHAGIADPREMSEVTATDQKLLKLVEATGGSVFWTKGSGLFASANPAQVDVPRVTLLRAARVFSGSSWMGLKDREAYVTRGVKLTPMFTGFAALAALLFLITLAWWREGR